MPDQLGGILEQPKQELPPREESGVEADEQAFEQLKETEETFLEEGAEAPVTRIGEHAPTPTPAATVTVAAVKDDATIQIEKIMEEGLGALYASLPDSAKPKFKQKGEEAATEIAVMVRTLKIQVARVLKLLRDWLLTIPNLNRFFLEQEAKIKTDRILELIEERKKELEKRP